MLTYKMSATRAVASYGNYSQPLYNGSSLNRKQYANQKFIESTTTALWAVNDSKDSLCGKTFEMALRRYKEIKGTDQGEDNRPLDGTSLQPGGQLSNAVPAKRSGKPRCLSSRSKNKIREKIESLYNCCGSKRFTFLTLSFINRVSDQDAQKCLNKFLTSARKTFGKFAYIWVAERQNENKEYPNNIHFHLITNKFFPIDYFNHLWVIQQYNAGIKSKYYTDQDIKATGAKEMHQKLNPVDVKHINSIKGLSIYLTMYVTKNTDTFRCATWHCCRSVSRLFTNMLISNSLFVEASNPAINWTVNEKTGEVYEAKTYVTEHAIIVTIFNKEHFAKKLSDINKLNAWVLRGDFTDKKTGKIHVDIPEIDYLEYKKIYLS